MTSDFFISPTNGIVIENDNEYSWILCATLPISFYIIL